MAKSAPKILYDEANRVKTDQLWIRYIITVNNMPVNIDTMGFGMEAEGETSRTPPVVLPTQYNHGEEGAINIVEVLTQTPSAAGLGSLTAAQSLTFYTRLYFAGIAGQVSLHQLKLTIDPRRTDDETYTTGGLYPEVFHINIDLDEEPEQIDGELKFPSLVSADFTRIEKLANFATLAALPAPPRDTMYYLQNTQSIGVGDNAKEYAKGLYFRSTDGTIIPISTTTLPLP